MAHAKTRKIVLIDPRFQLRMAGLFVGLQVLLTALFAFGLFLFMDSELQAGLASAHARYQSLDRMLLPIVAVLSLFSVLLSIILVTVFVVVLSHRIAGPIHRFKLVMDELAVRRIPHHTRIRPNDQLQELSATFTLAVDNLEADLTALKRSAEVLREAHGLGSLEALEPALQEFERIMDGWSLRTGSRG